MINIYSFFFFSGITNESRTFTCMICVTWNRDASVEEQRTSKFANENEFMLHRTNSHGVVLKWHCTHCKKYILCGSKLISDVYASSIVLESKSETLLKNMMISENNVIVDTCGSIIVNEKFNVCDICGTTFSSPESLIHHLKMNDCLNKKNCANNLKCTMCSRTFSTVDKLKRHNKLRSNCFNATKKVRKIIVRKRKIVDCSSTLRLRYLDSFALQDNARLFTEEFMGIPLCTVDLLSAKTVFNTFLCFKEKTCEEEFERQFGSKLLNIQKDVEIGTKNTDIIMNELIALREKRATLEMELFLRG